MFPNFQYTTNNKQNNPYTPYNNQYQYNQYNQFNQYPPQYSQPTIEFKRDEGDFDIKFFRLHPTNLNIINTPLNGLYNSLDSNEDESTKLLNKFTNFDMLNNFSIDNLLILNPSFGRIFVNETLEGLITFHNKSDHQKQIKDLDITLKVEENKNNQNGNKKSFKLNLKIPKDTFIQKRSVYSIKFSNKVDSFGKYIIDINVKSRSDFYDEQYRNNPQKYSIKKKGKDYVIENEKIEFSHNKRLTFDANLPFNVEKKFHNYLMNIFYIETKIINNTIYPLTITDIILTPKSKQDIIFKPIDDLKKLNFSNSNNNNFNTQFLTLQQDEETNSVFKIIFPNEFIFDENLFLLKIKWLNLFDFKEKEQIYEIKNEFITYNNYFKIKEIEKPEGDIIKNQNFKIMIKLETKNIKKKIFINLERETKADQDKLNDREFEIIDIIEKRIELSQKFNMNNFILICKSDYLGNVNMPKIKFIINEDNKIKEEISCDSLLHFNCISKEE